MINPRTASQCSRLCVDFGPLTSGNSNVIDLLPLARCPMWIVCHRKFRANLHRRMYVVFYSRVKWPNHILLCRTFMSESFRANLHGGMYVVCCSFVQNARCNLLCKIQSKSTLQNVRGFTVRGLLFFCPKCQV